MKFAEFGEDLAKLRDGALTFTAFAKRNAPRFKAMAGSYAERWPQPFLTVEDLAQEAVIEAWRSVDSWDPDRGVELQRFVEFRIGRKLRVELERVLGWPKKSRGTKAPKFVSVEAPDLDRILGAAQPPEPRRVLIEEAAARFRNELDRDVVVAVGLGIPIAEIAASIWSDPLRRVRYRISDRDDAVRRVDSVVRRASATLGRVRSVSYR